MNSLTSNLIKDRTFFEEEYNALWEQYYYETNEAETKKDKKASVGVQGFFHDFWEFIKKLIGLGPDSGPSPKNIPVNFERTILLCVEQAVQQSKMMGIDPVTGGNAIKAPELVRVLVFEYLTNAQKNVLKQQIKQYVTKYIGKTGLWKGSVFIDCDNKSYGHRRFIHVGVDYEEVDLVLKKNAYGELKTIRTQRGQKDLENLRSR